MKKKWDWRKWRAENREEYLAYRREWAQRPEVRAKRLKYHQENKERAWENSKANYKKLKAEIYKLLGKKCKGCGIEDERVLQIDHVNGGGGREDNGKRQNAITKKLKLIKENPAKYQILCANCNWIKRFEKGETGTYYDKTIKQK